jgi:hypothetical protein
MNRLIVRAILVLIVPMALLAQDYWAEHVIDSIFDGASCVYATNFDGDNDNDVLGGCFQYVTWWENDGNENFTEHIIANHASNPAGFRSLCAIDIDDDNDVDVLGAANLADAIFLWNNEGDGIFTEYVIDSTFDGAWSVYVADLDNDNDVDILGAAVDADDIIWWENVGFDLTAHVIDSTFDGARCVYAANLDGDNDIDVLGAASLDDVICWWENDGATPPNFIKHVIDTTFDGAHCVYAEDLDGDADIDVLGAANLADAICWWENDGTGDFIKHVVDSTFDGARSVYTIDIDGDTDVDILGAAVVGDAISWWENDGASPPNFTEHVIDSTFGGAWSVYAGDLDGDDDADVLGAARDADDITWWENELGVVYDVGVVSIDIPSIVPEDSTLNPLSTLKNMGTSTINIPITCKIEPGGYANTQSVLNVAPGDSIQVIFDDPFTFASGSYTVTVYTWLYGDMNPANDTLEKIIETYDPGVAEGSTDVPETFVFSAPTIIQKRSEIKLALPQTTKVNLVIYDVLGRLTETIVSKMFSAGTHSISVTFDFPAGVYFYRIKTTSGESMLHKFIILE